MEDINQHFEQLRRLLVKLGYPHSVDKDRICAGITTELLPLLHFGLLSHSKSLATFILESGYDLYKKNDLRFTEGIYKLLRNEFKYNPILQCAQFLTDKGFAKRKIQFVVKCLELGIAKHNQLIKKKKLETQSKISWNKTNLAKKVENIIKNNHNNNNNNNKKVIHTKVVKKIPNKPKQIIATQIITQQQEQEEEDNGNDNDDNYELSMNDSLSVDEIRSDLPQPIIIDNKSTEINNDDEDQQSENEHKDNENENENEEKAMEISNQQLYQQQQQEDEEEEEEVDQSIQIPQHTYDMNLIPEYDPNKYIHAINNNDNESDNNESGNKSDMDMDMKQTNEHYSGSYLETYSTLMDIPHNLLQNDNDKNENYSEQKHNIQTVIIGHPQNTQNIQNTQNLQNEESQDINNNNNNNIDHDNIDNDSDSDDDDDDDGNDEREEENNNNNNNNNNMNNAIEAIMSRLDRMENKMDKQFETVNARLTLLEGKIKFIESKQISNNNNNHTNNNISSASNGRDIKSSLSSVYKPISIKSSTSSSKAEHKEYKQYDNNNTFSYSQSTIGSSSLPISLTPNIHKTVAKTIGIQSKINKNQYPKHIHAPITPSPFIPTHPNNYNVHSFGLYNRHNNNNNIALMRYPVSNSSLDKNEMKSNVSSGIVSVATNNGSLYVPKIQSVPVLSSSVNDANNGNSNYNDPDNTLNFIKELKEMLKNTDELLKAKPISLYQSNI